MQLRQLLLVVAAALLVACAEPLQKIPLTPASPLWIARDPSCLPGDCPDRPAPIAPLPITISSVVVERDDQSKKPIQKNCEPFGIENISCDGPKNTDARCNYRWAIIGALPYGTVCSPSWQTLLRDARTRIDYSQSPEKRWIGTKMSPSLLWYEYDRVTPVEEHIETFDQLLARPTRTDSGRAINRNPIEYPVVPGMRLTITTTGPLDEPTTDLDSAPSATPITSTASILIRALAQNNDPMPDDFVLLMFRLISSAFGDHEILARDAGEPEYVAFPYFAQKADKCANVPVPEELKRALLGDSEGQELTKTPDSKGKESTKALDRDVVSRTKRWIQCAGFAGAEPQKIRVDQREKVLAGDVPAARITSKTFRRLFESSFAKRVLWNLLLDPRYGQLSVRYSNESGAASQGTVEVRIFHALAKLIDLCNGRFECGNVWVQAQSEDKNGITAHILVSHLKSRIAELINQRKAGPFVEIANSASFVNEEENDPSARFLAPALYLARSIKFSVQESHVSPVRQGKWVSHASATDIRVAGVELHSLDLSAPGTEAWSLQDWEASGIFLRLEPPATALRMSSSSSENPVHFELQVSWPGSRLVPDMSLDTEASTGCLRLNGPNVAKKKIEGVISYLDLAYLDAPKPLTTGGDCNIGIDAVLIRADRSDSFETASSRRTGPEYRWITVAPEAVPSFAVTIDETQPRARILVPRENPMISIDEIARILARSSDIARGAEHYRAPVGENVGTIRYATFNGIGRLRIASEAADADNCAFGVTFLSPSYLGQLAITQRKKIEDEGARCLPAHDLRWIRAADVKTVEGLTTELLPGGVN